MARKGPAHWLMEVADSVVQGMYDSIPAIAAGLIDGNKPFGAPPPEEQGPNLDAFLQANPDERHAYLTSLPPEQYATVTDQLMSEANNRYGAMASVLSPLFQLESAVGSLQQLAVGQQSGMTQVESQFGAEAARADLMDLLGVSDLN